MIRWLVSGGVGIGVAFALFAMMAASVDAVDLVGRVFRIFPLIRTTLSGGDERGEVPRFRAVAIEGTVARLRDGELVPLSDAVVIGENAVTGEVPVEVSSSGEFRFAAAFPNPALAPCTGCPPEPREVPQRLTVRAPGCAERIVPVNTAWVPHTILLDCGDRP